MHLLRFALLSHWPFAVAFTFASHLSFALALLFLSPLPSCHPSPQAEDLLLLLSSAFAFAFAFVLLLTSHSIVRNPNDCSKIPPMTKSIYTRRQMLQLSATAATAIAPPPLVAAEQAPQPASSPNLYAQLLETWCDGLLTHQETTIHNPALRGA